MRQAIVAAVLTAPLLAGGCGAGPDLETRTFRLEHLEPGTARLLIEPYIRSERAALQETGEGASAVTVRERPPVLVAIAEVLREYDRPRPTTTLHFQLIEADGFTESDPAIAEVESALRELFRFRGYRLMADAVLAHLAPGRATQRLRAGGTEYVIESSIGRIRGGDGAGTIQLAVSLHRIPPAGSAEPMLQTTLGVPAGQTVVIGSAPAGAETGTLILTVRPEIQE